MFKKLIAAAVASSLVFATPAVAHDRDRHRDDTAAVVIGAIIATVVLASDRDRYEDYRDYEYRGSSYYRYDGPRDGRGRYHNRNRHPRAERYDRCQDLIVRNRYGTYETVRVCD